MVDDEMIIARGFNPEMARQYPYISELLSYLFDTSRYDGSHFMRVGWARFGMYYRGTPWWNNLFKDIKNQPGNYTLQGVGNHSIVLRNREKRVAYKVSWELDAEKKCFQKLKERWERTSNVINLEKELDHVVLGLEYIVGGSLQQLIEQRALSPKEMWSYSADILNGLLELREAGIHHHRDLRPANIMIDEENDRAVIIDLGIATTDKEFFPQDNERFGGPNDLVSLGQVMYFIATQKHLFTESDSMHVTKIKRDLKDERERVYVDHTGIALRPYLEKVSAQTPLLLASIIQDCLTAKGSKEDYQTLEQKFKTTS